MVQHCATCGEDSTLMGKRGGYCKRCDSVLKWKCSHCGVVKSRKHGRRHEERCVAQANGGPPVVEAVPAGPATASSAKGKPPRKKQSADPQLKMIEIPDPDPDPDADPFDQENEGQRDNDVFAKPAEKTPVRRPRLPKSEIYVSSPVSRDFAKPPRKRYLFKPNEFEAFNSMGSPHEELKLASPKPFSPRHRPREEDDSARLGNGGGVNEHGGEDKESDRSELPPIPAGSSTAGDLPVAGRRTPEGLQSSDFGVNLSGFDATLGLEGNDDSPPERVVPVHAKTLGTDAAAPPKEEADATVKEDEETVSGFFPPDRDEAPKPEGEETDGVVVDGKVPILA